jgi:hypothetical protein
MALTVPTSTASAILLTSVHHITLVLLEVLAVPMSRTLSHHLQVEPTGAVHPALPTLPDLQSTIHPTTNITRVNLLSLIVDATRHNNPSFSTG